MLSYGFALHDIMTSSQAHNVLALKLDALAFSCKKNESFSYCSFHFREQSPAAITGQSAGAATEVFFFTAVCIM